MVPFFESLGNKVCTIAKEDKVRYHAAASLASNHVLGLLSMSVSMLTGAGFCEEDAYALLRPLVMNNLEKAFEQGAAAALTGPIERGDTGTVNRHLAALTAEERAVYEAVGHYVHELAERKHNIV
jgi:predicted short-subunit dehydrogenase-like oxidoreductase (DUF2520 family)